MNKRHGFSLIELLVVIAIIALLVSILLPALAGARRAARMAICQSNLRQMMTGHYTYSGDYKGYIAALSSKGTLRQTASVEAADEARRLIAEHTGRVGGSTGIPAFVNTTAYTMVIESYSHVVLGEYLGSSVSSPLTACPEDRARLAWRAAPLEAGSGAFAPRNNKNRVNSAWLPFNSSYQLAPAACYIPKPSQFAGIYRTYKPNHVHDEYDTGAAFGGQRMSNVVFSSGKVALMDSQQRHFGRTDLFYAYLTCQQPLAFFDGSVSNRKTSDSSKGWHPAGKTQGYVDVKYEPDLGFESPVPLGGSKQFWYGYYRWTHEGLGGFDFGGKQSNVPF